jgi:hypothetical protein
VIAKYAIAAIIVQKHLRLIIEIVNKNFYIASRTFELLLDTFVVYR